jgi:hypothetical protein
VVSPPGCGRSVTDFWGWDAHEAQLRCPDEVDGDTWIWSTRRGVNLSSTKLPRPWSQWESSLSRKNPHDRAVNRTRDLMISSQKLWPLDHEVSRTLCFFIVTKLQTHTWIFLCLFTHLPYRYILGRNLQIAIISYRFQSSTMENLRLSLCWDVTRRTFLLLYLCAALFRAFQRSRLCSIEL